MHPQVLTMLLTGGPLTPPAAPGHLDLFKTGHSQHPWHPRRPSSLRGKKSAEPNAQSLQLFLAVSGVNQ